MPNGELDRDCGFKIELDLVLGLIVGILPAGVFWLADNELSRTIVSLLDVSTLLDSRLNEDGSTVLLNLLLDAFICSK